MYIHGTDMGLKGAIIQNSGVHVSTMEPWSRAGFRITGVGYSSELRGAEIEPCEAPALATLHKFRSA